MIPPRVSKRFNRMQITVKPRHLRLLPIGSRRCRSFTVNTTLKVVFGFETVFLKVRGSCVTSARLTGGRLSGMV